MRVYKIPFLRFRDVVPADNGRLMSLLCGVLGYIVSIITVTIVIASSFASPLGTILCGIWGAVSWGVYSRWINRLHSRAETE